MTDLYRNKYRIPSTRLGGWDYSACGKYFVTICTKHFTHWFGEVRSGVMGLSSTGCIVAEEIQRTNAIRDHVHIDPWVVMPNHIHMIVHLGVLECNNLVETSRRDVSTCVHQCIPLCRFHANSLGAIVNHIKGACTKRIRYLGYKQFAWQPRFHEHIIRSDRDLYNHRNYIFLNSLRWDEDRNNVFTIRTREQVASGQR